MPYTAQERRKIFNPLLQPLLKKLEVEGNNGDVTYVIYKILISLYWGSFDKLADGLKVCVAAMLEFWRKKMVPYEDKKCEENGDVYE